MQDFQSRVKACFGDTKPFSIDGEEKKDLLRAEKAIYRFSEGKLWPSELYPGLRQKWINCFKEGKMDQKLALRILCERIHIYMGEQ